jgi:hypothetical protein
MCPGYPELLGFQIALVGPDHVNGMALPLVFAKLGQIVSFAFHDLAGGLGILTVDVKSQDQKHVDERTAAGDLATFQTCYRSVDHNVPVPARGWSDIDAQFSWEQSRFVPDFGSARSVGFVGGAFLGKGERLVPGRLVSVVHCAQEIISRADVLRVRQCGGQKSGNDEGWLEIHGHREHGSDPTLICQRTRFLL